LKNSGSRASERRLCDETHLNLAYRWFSRLGLESWPGSWPIARQYRPAALPDQKGEDHKPDEKPAVTAFSLLPAGFALPASAALSSSEFFNGIQNFCTTRVLGSWQGFVFGPIPSTLRRAAKSVTDPLM
jgi:hypothetical protein